MASRPRTAPRATDPRQESSIGTLFVVATPIGNLEDITLRAIRLLREVPLIAAEDTRVTRKLLARHAIATPLVSFHAHSGADKLEALVNRLSEGDLALVTDAGTPNVSDPGASLVRAARSAGHTVVAVPGPSAVAAALSVSGFPADSYAFLGYLPRRASQRRTALAAFADTSMTLVAFEAPHRLRSALDDLLAVFGDRELCVARELTKHFEESWIGSISDAVARWADEPPRGEFTLVVAGAHESRPAAPWDDERIERRIEDLRGAGVGARGAARVLAAESGRSAREIYRLWHAGLPAPDERGDERRDADDATPESTGAADNA